MSLAWTTRLLSGCDNGVGHINLVAGRSSIHPWNGHTDINDIAIHPAGILFASVSGSHVRLWRLSDRRTIAIFRHSSIARCVTFSVDGKHILSGGDDNILERAILDITTARDACLTGDLSIAEELLTQEIHTNANDFISYANRSFVMARKHKLDSSLEDAIKVIELDPLSYLGYNLKHAALYGEAIETFHTMLSILDNAPDVQTRKLRQQYLRSSEVERAIRRVIGARLNNAPLRVLDTNTGLLCNRETQIDTFQTSTQYKALVSSTITHVDLHVEHIEEVVGREGTAAAGYPMKKLRLFCETARDAGYSWAWSDTCCIDKSNNVEVQESVNSTFVWYHHSALTIVYLSDVPPSSKSGALAKMRGWTDRTPNHKDSVEIMQEIKDATGIDQPTIQPSIPVCITPEKNFIGRQPALPRVRKTYSLFGVFGVRLPVDYGEKQDEALGRLLQEIVARSGDISSPDWVGKSSEFDSCLPVSRLVRRRRRRIAGQLRALGLGEFRPNEELGDEIDDDDGDVVLDQPPTTSDPRSRNPHSGQPTSLHESVLELLQAGFYPLKFDPLFSKSAVILKVWRNPTRLPSDVQKATAVSHPKLTSYFDVIIFPVQGERSLASYLGGGDCDGGELLLLLIFLSDCFFEDTVVLVWFKDLVENFNGAPLCETPVDLRNDFEEDIKHLLDFDQRVSKLSDKEAQIAFQKVLLLELVETKYKLYSGFHDAVVYQDGYDSTTAVRLAYMFTTCLDAKKTGLRVKHDVFEAHRKFYGSRKPYYKVVALKKNDSPREDLPPVKRISSSPSILDDLVDKGNRLRDEFVEKYSSLRSSSPCALDHDTHLTSPYTSASYMATQATDWVRAIAMRNSVSSPRRSSDPREQQILKVVQYFAQRPLFQDVLSFSEEEIKTIMASYAYTRNQSFGFSVAFRELCVIKVRVQGGVPFEDKFAQALSQAQDDTDD
ncbi:RNA dependent RNA polymerase-domain-containing protein [Suillus discolor]|uniref:RNA-dependent RNA polymerase n=1 Tax=Suillus discolor TaxID=1912936 RepID=A0A9P7EWJ6_9AGAM|nr:RNA dependent RNA polymerase-domain-containing protein [Suillus discolor]KAG2095304.1 RNA dependent RNA polymerase-domain-containing protein [Suillus discolor]